MTERIIALVPAHNEEEQLGVMLQSLKNQTHPVDKVVVILDNCTDGTEAVALSYGAEVFTTVNNTHKKAGALNQALHLCEGYDYIFDGDADTLLDPHFIARALAVISGDPTIGAVSCREGIKTYSDLSRSQRFIYAVVRNQRYKWDTDRMESRSGNTQIVVGPAGLFKTEAVMVCDGWRNESLTEDAAISYDLRLAGYRTVLGKQCYAYSDSPLNLRELWRQRVRWSRGYQDIKARPWSRPMLSAKFQLLLERTYLIWLVLWMAALVTGHIRWDSVWILPIFVMVVDRLSRLRFFPRIWKTDVIMALVVPVDILIFMFWQATMVTAWVQGSVLKTERSW